MKHDKGSNNSEYILIRRLCAQGRLRSSGQIVFGTRAPFLSINSFNIWVSNLDRLPTRVRLASWGLQIPTSCCLCSRESETRHHILLTCHFSRDVCKQVLRLNPPWLLFRDLNELLSWSRMSTEHSPSILRKVGKQATIFHLWKQRNNAYDNSCAVDPAMISRLIYRDVKNIILERRNREQFRYLLTLWIM